jgi:hypothetical protein
MTRIDPNNTQAILIGASQFDFASEAGFQDLSGVISELFISSTDFLCGYSHLTPLGLVSSQKGLNMNSHIRNR